MANVNDILDAITNAVDKFSNGIALKENPVYKSVVNMVQKLQTKK